LWTALRFPIAGREKKVQHIAVPVADPAVRHIRRIAIPSRNFYNN
jgi:hypothetical protein